MEGTEKLVLKGELSTNTVWATANGGIAELLGVNSDAKGSLDTWAESLGVGQAEDTSAGNLSLDKGGLIEETNRYMSKGETRYSGKCTYTLAPTSRFMPLEDAAEL